MKKLRTLWWWLSALKKSPQLCADKDIITYPVFIAPVLDEFQSGSGVRARVGITGHKQPEAVSPACDAAKAQIRLYRLSVAATVWQPVRG